MSLISGWMGHASNIDIAKLQKEYAPILADGEQTGRGFPPRARYALFSPAIG